MSNDYQIYNANVSFGDEEEVSVTHLDVAAERNFSFVNEKNVRFISLENADACKSDTARRGHAEPDRFGDDVKKREQDDCPALSFWLFWS